MMKKSLLDPQGRTDVESRLARLRPGAERQWGTMTVNKMLCHIGDQLRCGLGELETHQRKSPMALPPLRWFFIHVAPWPKGKVQTAREMLATEPAESLEADRQQLLEVLGRFAEEMPGRGKVLHPLFGPISAKDWGVLGWRHMDHHLRQFDV